jgi:hypothetical protein
MIAPRQSYTERRQFLPGITVDETPTSLRRFLHYRSSYTFVHVLFEIASTLFTKVFEKCRRWSRTTCARYLGLFSIRETLKLFALVPIRECNVYWKQIFLQTNIKHKSLQSGGDDTICIVWQKSSIEGIKENQPLNF